MTTWTAKFVLQVDQNWHIAEMVYPEGAPIIARLPLGFSVAYTINMQVRI